ncbi:MAG: hypothetical protein WD749_02970 [Phycisphaerales bacterium]
MSRAGGVHTPQRVGERAGAAGAVPARRTVNGRAVAAALVIVAFATAALIAALAWTNRAEKRMSEPAVGAGAGKTGMHNEYRGLGKPAGTGQD